MCAKIVPGSPAVKAAAGGGVQTAPIEVSPARESTGVKKK